MSEEEINDFMDRDEDNYAIGNQVDSTYRLAKVLAVVIISLLITGFVGVSYVIYLLLAHFGVLMVGVF